MESLDTILSSGREAAPADRQEEVTQQAAEGESQQQPQTETAPEGESDGQQKMVPHEALHAEKQKVKRYTEEVADFRRQLTETNAAWERRMADLVQAVKPKQEQAPPPDWFENPELATRTAVQSTVNPQFDQINQTLLANAQLIAGIKYGDDKVSEAEQAFISALQSHKLDPADYQKVVTSPNRYAAAVQWHQRETARQEIGDDPQAFRAKLEAEILAKHGITPGETPAAQQQQRQPVMPSNLAGVRNVGSRSGPAWSGPDSIQDIFARKRSG